MTDVLGDWVLHPDNLSTFAPVAVNLGHVAALRIVEERKVGYGDDDPSAARMVSTGWWVEAVMAVGRDVITKPVPVSPRFETAEEALEWIRDVLLAPRPVDLVGG